MVKTTTKIGIIIQSSKRFLYFFPSRYATGNIRKYQGRESYVKNSIQERT